MLPSINSHAIAASDEVEVINIERFYEIKPRILKLIENEIKVRYSLNDHALGFPIHILKPEPYVFRAQENDNVFENEHIRLYIAPKAEDRNIYVFGVNHQNA
jgi:hypothetical protein